MRRKIKTKNNQPLSLSKLPILILFLYCIYFVQAKSRAGYSYRGYGGSYGGGGYSGHGPSDFNIVLYVMLGLGGLGVLACFAYIMGCCEDYDEYGQPYESREADEWNV